MAKKYRDIEMKDIAFELSLSYTEEATDLLLPFLSDFKLFKRGRRKSIRNLITYQHPMMDFKAYIFDYRFIVGAGNSRRSVLQTVFFIDSKSLGLPQFWMNPEHFFHKVGQFLKLQEDIDFVSYPAFSENYYLKGEDEFFIRSTFNEKILKFFSVNKNWSLEGVNYYMILYQKNRVISKNKIKDFYEKGLHLALMLKPDEL